MKKSKLISLLRTFSIAEMDQFVSFVNSPYHNSSEALIHLLHYLQKWFPNFPEEKISEEEVVKMVFSNKHYSKKKLSYLLSDLQKLAEHFLGIQYLKNEQLVFDFQVLKALLCRNSEKHYNYLYGRMGKKLNSSEYISGNSFYYEFLLADIAVDHFGNKEVRSHDENLQIASNALDDFLFPSKAEVQL